MTAEQHKAYTEACNAFGEALEKIFSPGSPRIGGQDVYIVKRSRSVEDTVRNWEILEFKANTGAESDLLLFEHDNYITRDKQATYRLDHVLDFVKTKQWNIHSVLRLSDNTVWTVGDKVINDTGGVGSITEFRITQDVITVNADCYFSFSLLSRLKKPAPLFTTADGVQVKEGDEIYVIAFEIGQATHCRAAVGLDYSFYYSTREAAEKAYDEWLYTQPVLSIWDFDGCSETGEALTARLKQLVKDKIAKR